MTGFLTTLKDDVNSVLGQYRVVDISQGSIFDGINGFIGNIGGVAKNVVGQGAGVVGSGLGGLLSKPYVLIGGAIALIIIIK